MSFGLRFDMLVVNVIVFFILVRDGVYGISMLIVII